MVSSAVFRVFFHILRNSLRDVQKKINSDLANAAEAELYASLPNGSARNGINANDAVSQNDKVLRIQGMVNKDRTVSAFLLANPFYYDNRLTDPAFRYAFRNRLLISNIGSRQWCVCGSPMDSLGMHPYVKQSEVPLKHAHVISHISRFRTMNPEPKTSWRQSMMETTMSYYMILMKTLMISTEGSTLLSRIILTLLAP